MEDDWKNRIEDIIKDIHDPNWCVCKNCRHMPTVGEEKCCNKESCEAESKNFKKIIKEFKKQQNPNAEEKPLCKEEEEEECKAESNNFTEMITLVRDPHYAEEKLFCKKDTINSPKRRSLYAAIRDKLPEYSVAGSDSNKDSALPSCMMWKIREEYPEDDGVYTGFPNPKVLLEPACEVHEFFQKEIVKCRFSIKQLLKLTADRSSQVENKFLLETGFVRSVVVFEGFLYGTMEHCLDTALRHKEEIQPDDLQPWMASCGMPVNKKPEEDKTVYFWKMFFSHKPNDKTSVNVFQVLLRKTKKRLLNILETPTMDNVVEALSKLLVHEEKEMKQKKDAKKTSSEKTENVSVEGQVSAKGNTSGSVSQQQRGNKADELVKEFPNKTKEEVVVIMLVQYFADLENWKYEMENNVHTVKTKDYETLCHLVNLYYGLRCIFVHGNVNKTLDSGVLCRKKRPSSAESLKILCSEKSTGSSATAWHRGEILNERLYEKWEKVEKEKKNIEIDQEFFRNVQSFYQYLAIIIARVCVCVVYYVKRFDLNWKDSDPVYESQLWDVNINRDHFAKDFNSELVPENVDEAIEELDKNDDKNEHNMEVKLTVSDIEEVLEILDISTVLDLDLKKAADRQKKKY